MNRRLGDGADSPPGICAGLWLHRITWSFRHRVILSSVAVHCTIGKLSRWSLADEHHCWH